MCTLNNALLPSATLVIIHFEKYAYLNDRIIMSTLRNKQKKLRCLVVNLRLTFIPVALIYLR